MLDRRYYSIRTGKNPNAVGYGLEMLLRLFRDLFRHFSDKDYFQEAFGFWCVDAEQVPGTLGIDIEAQMFRLLRKENLWPIGERYKEYSEDDVFDVIEFLYDHVSKPVDGIYHNYNMCGWHYNTFDKEVGQQEFHLEINNILCDYDEGYELTPDGEILIKGKSGLDLLFKASVPTDDPENILIRVNAAISKFRRYRSSLDDRRDAIRDLADVLEYLRPKAKNVLSKKDENDLFNLANNFGIRHHNAQQQTDYDKAIWYSWMFYYYLATIHAVSRLIEKNEESNQKPAKL